MSFSLKLGNETHTDEFPSSVGRSLGVSTLEPGIVPTSPRPWDLGVKMRTVLWSWDSRE